MSVRIQNDTAAGAAASEASRSEEASRVANGAGKPSSGTSAIGVDRIEISSLSESISASSRMQDAGQADRVRKLVAIYERGQYQVDSVRVSRALVEHAVHTGRPESNT